MDFAHYLALARQAAEAASAIGEVPVGAVIVDDDGTILATAHNLREASNNALGHAEILALQAANQAANSWRLVNATLVVTLEPCMMCLGAFIQARIKRIVFGAYDPKAGVLGGKYALHTLPGLNHYPEVIYVEDEQCSQLLTSFFRAKRQKEQ